MRLKHILMVAIFLLASPLLATDLYVARSSNCGLIQFCSPSLSFYRMDLDRGDVTLVRDGLGGYTTIAGFDERQLRVYLSNTGEFGCCRFTWLDLTMPAPPPGPLYPLLPAARYIFASGRMFAIQIVDVLEIDLATGTPKTVIMTLDMTAEPLAVDLERGRMYVAAHPGGTATDLRVIDLAKKTLSGPLMPVRDNAAVVIDRDGTAYVFDGPRFSMFSISNVYRLDAATGAVTPFGDVLINTQRLALDPVDRVVYGTYRGDVVSFDLVTRTSRVALPRPNATAFWDLVVAVVHKTPPRSRAVR